MRTFIAVELPEDIKRAIISVQDKLKASGADVKWVPAQNIHLTLKFLGEIDQDIFEKISLIMEGTAGGTPPFEADIVSVGAFPKISYPRVIWIGIGLGDDKLQPIVKTLEEKIQELGIPKEERAFASHITIGRVRSNSGKEKLVETLNKLEGCFNGERPRFKINKITLFRSYLSPKGPTYEILKEAILKAA